MISLRHPLRAKALDSLIFIDELAVHISRWHSNLTNDWFDTIDKLAKESGCGDYDIENSIRSNFYPSIEDFQCEIHHIYNALLVAICNICDSAIEKIKSSKNIKIPKGRDSVSFICRRCNFKLSTEAWAAYKEYSILIRPLRNQIVHNNFGTARKIELLNKMLAQNASIICDNGSYYITDHTFIQSSASKARCFLENLFDKLGYQTKLNN